MRLIQLTKIEGVRADEDGAETEVTKVCVINGDAIRCFYARRGDNPGTRITFTDGGGFAVTETPGQVTSLLGGVVSQLSALRGVVPEITN